MVKNWSWWVCGGFSGTQAEKEHLQEGAWQLWPVLLIATRLGGIAVIPGCCISLASRNPLGSDFRENPESAHFSP